MKNKLLKFIAIILSAITVLSMTACNNGKKPNDQDNDNQVVVTFTEVDLTVNANTDYKIVIPESFTKYEEYAANELSLYLKESTNANFPVVIDKGLEYDSDSKYISVGRTTLLTQSGVSVNESELGTDGYVIKRDGNAVLLCGGSDRGTLYGVYEFLHLQVEWEAYAVDEICYRKTANLKLLDFNVVDVPALPTRHGGFWSAISDPYFAAKWKVAAGPGTLLFGGEQWYYYGHSMFRVVPPSTYRAENPSWYSADGIQPCFTSEGFKKQYIANAKELFLQMPELIYLGIGLEDVNNSMCTCPTCTAEINKYTRTGLVIRWANEVTAIMRAWAKDVNLGREIYFPFIAYYETAQAPAEYNSQTGKYEPIDSSLILNEYSPVLYCRIDSNWNVPWEDEKNSAYMYGLEEWKACAKSLMFYNYTNDFSRSFEWWDSLYVITQNYGLAVKENGISVYDDSSNQTFQGFAFQRMFGYIATKIQWNPNVDTNELIVDYITNYYKEASDEVLEYYYLMKIQAKGVEDDFEENKKKASEADWVNRGVMDKAIALLKKGIQDIENAPYYTDAQKDKYIQRVEAELFTPLQYVLDFLDSEYSAKTYLELVDEMEEMVSKYGVTNLRWFEGQAGYKSVEEVIANWRAKKAL